MVLKSAQNCRFMTVLCYNCVMNELLTNILWRNASVYMTEEQLAHLLDGTPDSRYARLHRAVAKGQLLRVKRGLYCLGERLAAQQNAHPFELAQLVYGPSYISLESALSYYGLIPEAVRVVTSVTTKRNKKFLTPLGEFSYRRLPTNDFFLGVNFCQDGNNKFFMASPWKAILDYIYCYKKEWHTLTPMVESLRLDVENLPKISKEDLLRLKEFYHCKRIDRFIANFPVEFIDES